MADPTENAARADVSVVIAFHEAHATLPLQLEALLAQEEAPRFDVVVVDNRSSRSPESIVAEWRRNGLDVRVVEAHRAQGTSYARNVGVASTTSSMIVFVDADDCVGPRFISSAVDALRHVDVVDGEVRPVAATEFDDGREHLWRLLDCIAGGSVVRDAADHDYPILMGGACAMTRQVFLELEGFDQTFFPGAEDNDLALRIVRSGRAIARHSGMALAERRRASDGAVFKRAYDAGRMHIALCARHALWSASPHLRDPNWLVDLAKLPVVVARSALPGTGSDVRRAVASRAGLRLGQAVGMLTFRVLRRPVTPQLGVGLDDGVSSQ
ncbi:glycosyltransferase family 2 protein [Dermacoccus abyssi]|uniref:glycosyltransferase family 2 protein n=1 Tax=Dermacoccus abyssi TaxID=322596 RepID=UPI0021A4F78D|nr:glycosyltransferase family A protein [Dermacoccus abyssi]MCT1986334.1 glycosyltransferase family 2 protein [Dermacoccus abyssi]